MSLSKWLIFHFGMKPLKSVITDIQMLNSKPPKLILGELVSFFVHVTFFFSEACFFCLQLPFLPCRWNNVSCLYKDAYDMYTVYIVSSLLYLSYKKWRWRRKSKLDKETFRGLPTVTLAEERTDAGLFWTVILSTWSVLFTRINISVKWEWTAAWFVTGDSVATIRPVE